jgi:3-hydroxyisobutyrate dehydrogenase-like beta-hydroxyacid dehydrogenase
MRKNSKNQGGETMGTAFDRHTVGWIGAGRMGSALAARMLQAGIPLQVYNRTRSKAEPLAVLGATLVDSPADLADRDIVFSIVSGPEAFLEVTTGPSGLLSRDGVAPRLLVDFTTLSTQASATVRAASMDKGTALLDAPVSGSAAVVNAGKLAVVVSGERSAYDLALPYLHVLAGGVTYVGPGERARLVKICHNLLLAAISQSLAEVTVLAEKGGIARHAFLDFINHSVLGSMFTRYKTPAFVQLDFTPTFTSLLLRKDLDLGLDAARALEVPLPVTAEVRKIVQSVIDNGGGEHDFAVLLEHAAQAANLVLEAEDAEVGTGL